MVTDPKRDTRTTYGAYALRYSVAPRTDFIIQRAEAVGAIVLRKVNLQVNLQQTQRNAETSLTICRSSEAIRIAFHVRAILGNSNSGRSFNSSGWSKIGGRTVSPFDFGVSISLPLRVFRNLKIFRNHAAHLLAPVLLSRLESLLWL